MSVLPEPAVSETTETYSYKLASLWSTQLRYVVALRSSSLTPKYINLVSLVRTLLDPESELDPICDYVNRNTGRKWDDDIIKILIFSQASDLEVEDITQLGSGGQALEIMNALMIRINDFARRRNASMLTLASMQSMYQDHITKTAASLQIVRRKLVTLIDTQSQYLRAATSDVLRISELEISNESLNLIVSGDLTREDTLTIFDNARISYTLQHVICGINTEVFQKAYTPGPFDPAVKRQAILNVTFPGEGVVLFTIALSQIYSVRYTIESGLMETSVRPKDKKEFLSAIRNGFPMLEFEVRTKDVECKLSLYPTEELTFEIPFHILLHRSVVEEHLFQFYLNESTSSFPEKNKFKFRYKSYWELPSSREARDDSTFILSTPRMANGTNYINLIVASSSENAIRRMLTSLIPTICIFFREDIMRRSSLADLYDVPGLVSKSNKPTSKLRKELADKWPEVFTPAYLASRETTTKNLVRITTDEEEAERWGKETIIHELTQYPREVLPFPPEADEGTVEVMFWFTSVRPEARCVGYRRNDYDDSPKYPWVPFSSAKRGVQKIKGVSGGNVVSLAAQGEGLYAEAPDVVSHILGFEARRRGVAFGVNSIIEALLDMTYEFTDEEPTITRDQEVATVRQALGREYRPELYRQQLYDLSNDEIRRKLDEKDQYFDPLIYSAGLEKYFDVDIYYIKARIVQNVRTMTLELPRYSHFYCASKVRRNCVVILINNGVRSDRLKWPHCELIVPKDSNVPRYGPEVSTRLAIIREECHKFLTCTGGKIYKGSYMSSAMNEVLARSEEIINQYIDPYGKARAFTVRSSGRLVTLFCYPCAPLSLPHSSEVYPAPNKEWLEKICQSKILGCSTLGAWCKDKTTREILYARLSLIPDDIPIIGVDPLTSLAQDKSTSKFTSDVSAKDRLALVLKEVLIWALDVSGLSHSRFSRTYLTYSTSEENEDEYYDITTIGRRLPVVPGITEAIAYLSRSIPVHNGKLVLHNQAYYLSIVYLLSRHPRTTYKRDVRFIKDYYRTVGDFRSDKNAVILAGLVDPLTSVIDPLNKYAIANYISEVGRLPIFYMQGDVLWIVQATHLKEIKCAYQVCKTWRETKINIGYHASPVKDIVLDVLLYKVVAGRLIAAGKLRGGEDEAPEGDYYEVVELGTNNYAALLRASE